MSASKKRFLPFLLTAGYFFLCAFLQGATPAAPPTASVSRRLLESHVAAYCLEYGLDPRWVRAIIRVESDWNAKAVSPKGAVGVMQLMPGTARRFRVANRFHAAANLRGGIEYLAWLLRHYRGNRPLATAAYYTGEHRIKSLKDLSPDVRRYVALVYSHYVSGLLSHLGIDPKTANAPDFYVRQTLEKQRYRSGARKGAGPNGRRF